jgi:Outer membrane lipoprotein carrier protein LolA-like
VKTFLAALAMLALVAVARSADVPGTLLSPGGDQGEWKPLIDALAAKGNVVGPFEERRYFTFRRDPLVLKGTIRISPERGLSLQYAGPEASIMIADSSGLLLRDADGRSRELPAGSRQAGAIAALLPIMRFDLAALYPRFEIHARRSGADWTFEFTPRDADVAGSLGEIYVGGTGTDVQHLEFRHSATQRVVISVGETRSGEPFAPADLKQFFR